MVLSYTWYGHVKNRIMGLKLMVRYSLKSIPVLWSVIAICTTEKNVRTENMTRATVTPTDMIVLVTWWWRAVEELLLWVRLSRLMRTGVQNAAIRAELSLREPTQR
jgi:hypothetical protein